MEMLTHFHNPVIFVSHNRDEVYRLAERIGSMESGVLRSKDEAQRLCEDWLVTQDRCYIN